MSTYDHTPLAARFRALASEPLPMTWDEVLEEARGESTRFRAPLRSRRSRLAVFIAVALIGVIGAASAFGTVRGLLDDGPAVVDGYYYNRSHTCKGKRGTVVLSLGRGAGNKPGRWRILHEAVGPGNRPLPLAPATGQYADATGGGSWRSDLVEREGSKLWIARLSGTITSGRKKQRVLITLEGGGAYTPPGRISPHRFVLRPLERGPLKPDSGSQRTVTSG